MLPGDLAVFFPRLVNYSLDRGDVFLTQEYYGYSTLSEMWVFEDFDPGYWQLIFESLARILECFSACEGDIEPNGAYRFYWQKTVDRLETLAVDGPPQIVALLNAPSIQLNGVTLDGWPALQAAVQARLRTACKSIRGQIIHGDLCFPNILYDPLSRLFKFIDPRGSFADSGIYGDPRYDAAKLLHSIDGGYDFIIHDMFVLKQEGTSVELQQFFPPARDEVLARFATVFGVRFNMDEIRLLEGLLFLSMCPLHSDYPKRQAAMFAIGLKILNEVVAS